MISEILLAATVTTSSALAKPSSRRMISFEYSSQRRSLLMTNKESTFLRISSTPCNAFFIFTFPSKANGIVTTPTVKIPFSFAMPAMTGAAPVPVPPPIPQVMNTISVSSSNKELIAAKLVSAASLPFSGFPPTPSPSSPNWIFTGISACAKAWLSVLQMAKRTLCTPCLYMFSTALLPPPPTPITLIMFWDLSLGENSSENANGIVSFDSISIYFKIFIYIYLPRYPFGQSLPLTHHPSK